MRLGISTYTYVWAVGVPGYPLPPHPMTAADLLGRAGELGVGVVQFCDNLPLDRLSSAESTALRTDAQRRQLLVEVGTCGIEPANLRAYLRIAQFFESPFVRLVIDTASCQPAPEEIVTTLRSVIPEFEAAGVCLAIENHDRFRCSALVEILKRLDSSAVGVCLDTANSLGALETIETVVELLGPWTLNLHVKDFEIFRPAHQKGFAIEGRPAGRGRLDIPCLLDRLRALGRDPNAILELWPPPEPDVAAAVAKEAAWAAESIGFLRTLIPD